MPRRISFHPVDPAFFDDLVTPLISGEKVNPERFLDDARRMRATEWKLQGYRDALQRQLDLCVPPPPPEEGPLWARVKARLDRMEFRPDPLARLVAQKVEPELHLSGRPFLITEGSADRVAALTMDYLQAEGPNDVESLLLEQLIRLDPQLAGKIEPVPVAEPSAEMTYRNELLAELKALFDIAKAARAGEDWGRFGGERTPGEEVLVRELPFRALSLHARARPFWHAMEVDGLDTVCRAAEIEPPAMLVPPWPLFASTVEAFPALREALDGRLPDERGLGGYVPAEEIPELLAFLASSGSTIIRAASQAGEGPACTLLLRKIKECAQYAEKLGHGYVEAVGIDPAGPAPAEPDDA